MLNVEYRTSNQILIACFFSHFFCPYLNQSPTKNRVFFSIFALILTKVLQKGCFSLFCPYSNQSFTKRGVFFSIFALTLTRARIIRMFFSFFALILTKALPKRVFFSIFYLNLTKALRIFFLLFLCPYSNQICS